MNNVFFKANNNDANHYYKKPSYNYIGIIDQENRRVFKKKSINDLLEITKTLYPYKREIQGIAVESTFQLVTTDKMGSINGQN